MKTVKRIASILVAILITATLSIPTFANGYSISVVNTNPSISIHNNTYNAYLLFEAVQGNPGAFVFNPVTCLAVSYTPAGGTAISGSELLTWLGDDQRTTAELHDFSTSVYNDHIDVTPAPTPTASGTASGQQANINLSIAGYHLVTGGGERNDNHSPITALASLSVTNPTSVVNPKFDVPQLEKEVFHDDLGDYTGYSDHAIGDDVTYRISTTVPATIGYTDYDYIITDTLTEGLSFNNDLSMTAETGSGTIIIDSTYFTVTEAGAPANGFTLDIDLMALINAGLVSSGDTLVAEFSANLNEGAVVDPDGTNDNNAVLSYSNDPQDLFSVGNTPTSVTQSSTFKIQLIKTNTSAEQLEGAEFVMTLEDQLTTDIDGNPTNALSFIQDPTAEYTLAPSGYVGSTTTTITAGSAAILGLNSNTTYYLHEITPPDGYVLTTTPTSFELLAEYDDTTGELLTGYPTMLVNDSTTPIAPVLDVINYQDRGLPDTGSSSAMVATVCGVTLLLIGFTMVLLMQRGNKKC